MVAWAVLHQPLTYSHIVVPKSVSLQYAVLCPAMHAVMCSGPFGGITVLPQNV